MMRKLLTALTPILVAIMALSGIAAGVSANTNLELPGWGEPNGLQAGPLGLNPAPQRSSIPRSIAIPDADVDAEIERNQIVDGIMLDPSGPWVVSWYQETGLLGEVDNAVMSGHVDYWDVGPAVFWTVGDLPEGAEIQVRGDDGATYTYAVEWVRTYEVAGLTPETVNEIVGQTDYPALTLITCGGAFDYETGEYLARTIVRSRLVAVDGLPVEVAGTPGASVARDDEPETNVVTLDRGSLDGTGDSNDALVAGGTATVTGSGVNMRADASTDADIVVSLAEGQEVTVTDGPRDAGGYTWWRVQLGEGTEGWVAADFLAP